MATLTGGKIFYIDNSATGAEYTFYDSKGNVLTDVQVGDEPYAYDITGTPSADKYYIFHDELFASNRWTYNKDRSDHSEGYVYDYLGTGIFIGQGKTNTATVMAADNGAYVTADSNGYPTIWYQIKLLNDANTGSHNDWFVPSRNEVDALRTAVDRDGNHLVTWFNDNYIWSSSDDEIFGSRFWYYKIETWYILAKFHLYSVFAVRAF